jgi:peroxiredoxin Q/BCP
MPVLRSLIVLVACALSGCEARAALPVGAEAPDFEAPAFRAGVAERFSLADARARGPVVVYFFPAANTPGCNLEASLFSQAVDRFAGLGASVIGVTAGNTDELQAFSSDKKTCAGRFPVAADGGARIAAQYGAVPAGRDGASSRTSFLVGADGRVLAVHDDRQPQGHVRAMLDALADHAR